MTANNRALTQVILLAVGILLGVFLLGAVHQANRDRAVWVSSIQHTTNQLAPELQAVYKTIVLGKTNASNKEMVLIEPAEVRSALAMGINASRELSRFLSRNSVFTAKQSVPLRSGRFICFVQIGQQRYPPFGLTSTGECRFPNAKEMTEEDFKRDFVPVW